MSRSRPRGAPGTMQWQGHRLAYEILGEGPGTVVLLHGLLLPRHVNIQMARALADAGHRVVLLDLLGHGDSDHPVDPAAHRLDEAALQVLALLDHLELDRVVLGGMSLGANVTLQIAADHPERLAGMILEMPVLERGAVGVVPPLAALWALFRFGGPPVRGLLWGIRVAPLSPFELLNAALDVAAPPETLSAVLHGYVCGPTAPPRRVRERIEVPALVIGHGYDAMHPIDDARALRRELPQSELLHARHLLELRTRPERLCGAVADYVTRVLATPPLAAVPDDADTGR